MLGAIFEKSFTQQEPLPETAIERVGEIMRSGRLHRYNTEGDELSEAALLERDYARWQGADYCLACASGGYAIQIALRAAGARQGSIVLANAYTLAPVPGAIHNIGAIPYFVDIDHNWLIDLDDLEQKASRSGARFLLLSHMRGHLCDMERLADIAKRHDLTVVEDCAHTMGAKWSGVRSGNFGHIACFSTQTYKHINSGEGGLLTTNDPEIAARAILHSGSYMLYERHGARPDNAIFDEVRLQSANYSGRMDNIRAAIIRAQLDDLDDNVARWNRRYQAIEAELNKNGRIFTRKRPQAETYVGSSIQFRIENWEKARFPLFVNNCGRRGVEIKWFGADQPQGFTSKYNSWAYLGPTPGLLGTDVVLSTTCDLRIPLTFDEDDCRLVGKIISEEVSKLQTVREKAEECH